VAGCGFSRPSVPSVALPPAAPVATPATPRVELITTEGAIVLELDAHRAPRLTESFLKLVARSPVGSESGYSGSALCRVRNPVWIAFGCVPDPTRSRPLRAVDDGGLEWPEEIDGPALGLASVRLDDSTQLHTLWQEAIYPRWRSLVDEGRTVPAGLQAWVDDLHRDGTAAEDNLLGMTRLDWLEGMGFQWTEGGSRAPFDRGAVAAYAEWPGDGDARFVLALDRVPQRDGRSTVFGRVLHGWETLERIRRLPLDKSRRPKIFFRVEGIRRLPDADSGK